MPSVGPRIPGAHGVVHLARACAEMFPGFRGEQTMKMTGHTVFISGGSSGIGRALAEALQGLGNQVIISGRRAELLAEITGRNPGMKSVELDMEDPMSISAVAKGLIAEHPALNVLINNAGIMKLDGPGAPIDEAVLTSTVTTNLLGPIRLTSALIEHLKTKPSAAVMYTTSGLAFTPMAAFSVYSATKAALHSYILSQRYALKGTRVKVIEIAPPYVQTELTGNHQLNDPRAMPLKDYIAETMQLLNTDNPEILVKNVLPLRNNAGPNEAAFVDQLNDMMKG
jgi:uncharacterized oxidoreductase